MATKEKKQIRVIGPKAASWPWINKPETQQNGSTAWTIKVIVDKAEAEKYRALARQYGDGMIPISKEKENKVETGKFVIKFKRNCNKKDGSAMSPPGLERFNDGNWEKIAHDQVKLGGGSEVSIAFSPYAWQASGNTGVSFWLEKVRVHKLVEFQTKEDAIEWGDCPDGVPFEVAKVAEPKAESDEWDTSDEDF
jgi:hypothetical protein|tara:strand:- start:198 stop:779 length:582 start_codon:yes stop_codon:yes gene_type:complete